MVQEVRVEMFLKNLHEISARKTTRTAQTNDPALTPQQQAEARKRRSEGATLKELAQSYNVGIATIPACHRG
jgi:hypothetical protein